ncbi:MAG TPA: zf-HC2 domain-containing protein, partial [Streptosporangiaceae bacterium]|nr:zf-HC2 domain-containing protein [Streptosporangiaceae bacterium]
MRRHRAHVDAAALAEFREGLIGGRRAVRIQEHLAGCERCAGIEAGLTRVTALLAAVPQPVMPDGLAR